MHTQDISAYQHPHVFHDTGTAAERSTQRVVLLTGAMMIVEIVAGWLYNSMALFADGWHMSTHAAALGISWLAFVLARSYASDRRFAFGTWKIEILGGFVSAILLGLVALAMVGISCRRMLHPVPIRFNQAICVAAIGLVVNVVSVFLLQSRPHGQAHPQEGAHHHHVNLNLKAAYLHVIADAVTSVLAITALMEGKYLAWNWLDPLMGIVGAVLILRWTRSLLLDTGNILLDRESNGALAADIRARIESCSDTRVSDLHIWKVGEGKYACIVALVAEEPRPVAAYKDLLHTIACLVHVTVEATACSGSRHAWPHDGCGKPRNPHDPANGNSDHACKHEAR